MHRDVVVVLTLFFLPTGPSESTILELLLEATSTTCKQEQEHEHEYEHEHGSYQRLTRVE